MSTKIKQTMTFYNSPFDGLKYDESYEPDEATLRSARFLAGYGYDVANCCEAPILSNVISIRKVINHKETLASGDEVLHLKYECWVHSNNYWHDPTFTPGTFNTPDIIYRYGTVVLIKKSILLRDEIDEQSGFADWIAADEDSDNAVSGVAISSGRVPANVVEEYITHLKRDWYEIASLYFDLDEPNLDSVDPRIKTVIKNAIRRYKK